MDPAKEMQDMIEELKERQIPSVEEPVPLYTWWTENTIKDEMLWKKAASNQMHFVDDLNGLVQNKLKEKERTQVQVISEHISKSILLPVYLLRRGDLQIILRENFYNWKMSVICNRTVDANFDGLFHTTPPIEPDYTGDELASVYFEGFPKDLIFDYYEKTDQKVWSAKLHNDQILWTTVYLILKAVGYVTPTEWTTKAKHQAELAERSAKREAKNNE